MTVTEDRVRELFAQEAARYDDTTRVGRDAWMRGRRSQQRHLTATATVGVLAVAAATAGIAHVAQGGPAPVSTLGTSADATGVASPPGGAPAPTTPADGSPTSGPIAGGTPTIVEDEPEKVLGDLPDDPGLDAVDLPDPAPGFRYRRSRDEVATTPSSPGAGARTVLAKIIVVEASPVRTVGQTTTPTGPEVSVTVSRAGTVAPDPLFTVTGTTTVLGEPAQVLQDSVSHRGVIVSVTVGGFDIVASGRDADATRPVTVEQVDNLLNSVTGIPHH